MYNNMKLSTRKLAEGLLFEINKNNFQFNGKGQVDVYKMNINSILEFGRKCCENQKEICADNAKLKEIEYNRDPDKNLEIDKESIRNCQNFIDIL